MLLTMIAALIRLMKWTCAICFLILFIPAAFADSQTTATNQTAQPTPADKDTLLLDLLVKKGYVTQNEAQSLRSETESLQNSNNASFTKWSIGKGIKSVELFGDIRLRFENRQARTPSYGAVNLDRYRYALRLGLRGDLTGDFYYGLRLETASNPRSPWVTFATSASGTPYQGPFGKSTAGLNLGQIFIGWRAGDYMDITLGKMPQPLYTTPMVWDSDLCPEGAAERFKYSIGPADFFANFGQFIYQDDNPTTSTPFLFSSTDLTGRSDNPPFLATMQGGFKYNFTTNINFKAAATLYEYLGHGSNSTAGPTAGTPGFSDIYVGAGAGGVVPGYPYVGASGYNSGSADGFYYNQTGVNNLLVVEFPFELNFMVLKQRARIFGDYAQNLQGNQRAAAASDAGANAFVYEYPIKIPYERNQNEAYQLGFAIGNGDDLSQVYGTALKKGVWEARVYWQHTDQYALDPNLVDSDFFEGRENLQGVYAAVAYCFTDAVVGTLRYGYAARIDKKLGTGGSNQDIPQVNPVDQYQVVQLDLGVRF